MPQFPEPARPSNHRAKWTNADLPSVSKYGYPEGFEPETQLNLQGFEPLENVDLRAPTKPEQPKYTGDPNRRPAGEDIPDNEANAFGLKSIWNAVNTPLTDVFPDLPSASKLAKKASEWINPNREADYGLRSVASAYIESLGHVTDGMTSPLSLGTIGAGSAGTALAKSGARAAARTFAAEGAPTTDAAVEGIKQIGKFRAANTLRNIERAAGIPQVIEGGRALADPNMAWEDKLNAVGGAAVGALGLRNSPHVNHLAESLSGPVHGPDVPAGWTGEYKQPFLADVNPPGENIPAPTGQRSFDFNQKPDLPQVRMPNEFLPDNSFDVNAEPARPGPLNIPRRGDPLPPNGVFDESGRSIADFQPNRPSELPVRDVLQPDKPAEPVVFENRGFGRQPRVKDEPPLTRQQEIANKIAADERERYKNNQYDDQGRSVFPKKLDTTNDPEMGKEPSPFPVADEAVMDEMLRNKQVDYTNPRLEDIPLQGLKGTQSTVDPNTVSDYQGKGDRPRLTEVPDSAKGRMDDQAPVVIRIGDENILAGGHHRATADLANGKESIQAIVYDANVPPELLARFKASLDADKARAFEKDQLSDNPSVIDDNGQIGWEPDPDQRGYTGKPLTQEQYNKVRNKFWDLQNQGDLSPEQLKEAHKLTEILSDPRYEKFDTEQQPIRYPKADAEEVMHGDTLEVATPDGETFWLDNINNPEEITAKIRSGELEVIQKTGNKGMKSAGSGSTQRPVFGDEPNVFPMEMRAKKKPENVAMGGAEPRVLDILGNSLYGKKPEVVAVKELLQNSIDEHKISGSTEPLRVVLDRTTKDPVTGEDAPSLTIRDYGRGMTPEQIYTVFTDVGKSGKMDEAAASGGFGFAKASPMLGGRYSRYESVVIENGKKVKYTFEGTPKDLKNQDFGVPLKREVVNRDTPTGFKATIYYNKKNNNIGVAETFATAIGNNSVGSKSPLQIRHLWQSKTPEQLDNFFNKGVDLPNKIGLDDHTNIDPSPELPIQDTLKIPGAEIDFHYETPDPDARVQQYMIDTLNNGMYQFSEGDSYSQHGALKGVPENIKANVRATVAEGEEFYPYTLNREQVADHVKAAIDKWIEDNIKSGALDKQRQSLRDMYTNMHPIAEPLTFKGKTRHRPTVIFDPDNLLNPKELSALSSNRFIFDFSEKVDSLVNDALNAVNPAWGDRIEKVGISLDPGHHGVWIPNPDSAGKATILINPFEFIIRKSDPREAARENMSTTWHEVGHTQTYGDEFSEIDWSNVDTTDPEIGSFFQKYMNEVAASSMGQRDAAHGLSWLRATAEVYAKSGSEAWHKGVDELNGLFQSKSDSGYSKDVQNALLFYTTRKGRQGTAKNLLSGTGVNSEVKPFGGESVFGDVGSNGERTSPVRPNNPTGENLSNTFNKPIKWSPKVKGKTSDIPVPDAVVKDIQRKGKVDSQVMAAGDMLKKIKEDTTVTRDEKENLLEKALNFQRTVLTSADISAPGRQGLPLITRKEWWTSWKPMFEAMGSDKGYATVMDSIKNDPSGMFRDTGKKGKSFANEAGLSLTDTLDHREELFRSKFAEEFAGTKWFVKPSVRAYTAYLNKLRADTFKNLVNEAGVRNNLGEAKKIADFINIATGRGNLGAFEPAAKPLAQIFFSPRLTTSRLQMYTRTFNPFGYAEMPPVVRREQLRSMLGLASAGLLIGQLAKGIGATVNTEDATNSDFGKIRFGNTRIDPFGGHQQFLVAAARLLTGQSTTSPKQAGGVGKTHDLTSGKFGMPTRASVFGNFMKNKLAPVPAFIWSWMEGKDYDGKPFSFKDEAVNKITPIVAQDLYEIWKEDPTLLQGLFSSASAFGGGGVQTYGR